MNIQGSGLGLTVDFNPLVAESSSNRSSRNNTPDFSVQLSTVSTNATTDSDGSFSLRSSPDAIIPSDGEMSRRKDSRSHGHYSRPFRKLAPVEMLPPELLTHIFSFLSDKENQWSTLLVCKNWYSATVDTLWFRPNILHLPTLELLLTTLDTHPSQLTLDYASLIRRVNLINLAKSVSDVMLLRLQACTKLERLTLAGCSKLSDDSLVPLLKRNNSILSVDMTGMDLVTDKTLTTLATSCPKLQGLYASGCKHITDASITALALNCPNLKRMKLNGCSNISDEAMRNLINRCPMLVEFDLTGCANITDDTAYLAYTRLTQLREYRLSLDSSISDRTILSVPANLVFDKLRIMDFSGCVLLTDEGIGRLVAIAPKLRNVVLAKCYNITDRGLFYLSKLGRNLHYIHLGHCNNITNTGISNLVKPCNRIQYIDIACCNQLQDQAIRDIAQLPKLRRVGLVKCQNVTDQGIHAFTYRTGQENTLERIHLSYCTNISLIAVTHLINTCQRLTHLSLTGVPAFMREDLFQFCREPPPEFTQHQQQVFCVFSGQGVRQLRDYLNQIANENRRAAHHRAMMADYRFPFAEEMAVPNLHPLTNQPLPVIEGVPPQDVIDADQLQREDLARRVQTTRQVQQLQEHRYWDPEHGLEPDNGNDMLPGFPTQNQFQELMNLLDNEAIGPVNAGRMGRPRAMMALAQQLERGQVGDPAAAEEDQPSDTETLL